MISASRRGSIAVYATDETWLKAPQSTSVMKSKIAYNPYRVLIRFKSKHSLRGMETNDFVSYELSVKLKAAGFNELTNSFYDEASVRQGEFEIVPTYAKFNEVSKTPRCECVSAPTLWQAQKWLREKKKIDVLVYNCACGYIWELSKSDVQNRGTILVMFDDNGEDKDSGCWLTYEAALSAGIAAALKLMEEEYEKKLIKRVKGVEWYDDGLILLRRCPECGQENYAPAVASGVCCWCGYKAEPIKE